MLFIYLHKIFYALAKNDITKFKLHLNKEDIYSYPEMIWGQGNGIGGNIGYIRKLPNAMQFQYTNDAGNMRALELNASQGNAVRLYADGGEVMIDSDTKIIFACGASKITMTPNNIKLESSRIDLG